jgi:SAM-dependent methyltransferase
MNETKKFYAGLTPLYHLIYPDWEQSIQQQARDLDSLIRELWGDGMRRLLDVSCGIGTQALGLTQLGYKVTASDLSPEEVERAGLEASRRDIKIAFSVADMRESFTHHARQFDVVISCDNSVPHLLTDADIFTAFKQLYQCIRPGGGCIVSVRDYEKEDFSKQQIKPYGIREQNGVRWLLWQVWDPHGPTYDVTFYFVEDRGNPECRTHALRSTYYAVGIPRLMELMKEAGFEDVRRVDNRFFQPVIIGTREAQPSAPGYRREAAPQPEH